MTSQVAPILILLLVTSSGPVNAALDRPTARGVKAPTAVHGATMGGVQATTRVTAELRKRDLLQWSDELAGNLATADAETLMVALEVFCRAGQPERVSQGIRRLQVGPPQKREPVSAGKRGPGGGRGTMGAENGPARRGFV